MDTRGGRDVPGDRKRARRIEAPAATPSHPERGPQLATFNDSQHSLSAQIPTCAGCCCSRHQRRSCCRKETHLPLDGTPTAAVIVFHGTNRIPSRSFTGVRLIFVEGEHDDLLRRQWSYDMLFGRWVQTEEGDDITPCSVGTPIPRSPSGPIGGASAEDLETPDQTASVW